MTEFGSLGEREHVQAKVDLVDQIIFGMSVKAALLRRDIDRNQLPDQETVDSLIDKVDRLRIALEGCKVDMPERAGGR